MKSKFYIFLFMPLLFLSSKSIAEGSIYLLYKKTCKMSSAINSDMVTLNKAIADKDNNPKSYALLFGEKTHVYDNILTSYKYHITKIDDALQDICSKIYNYDKNHSMNDIYHILDAHEAFEEEEERVSV